MMPVDIRDRLRSWCDCCWRAAHPPPPHSPLEIGPSLYGDWQHEAKWNASRGRQAADFAHQAGYEGSVNDLQYAAHREAYTLGDDEELRAMLNHVQPDDYSDMLWR